MNKLKTNDKVRFVGRTCSRTIEANINYDDTYIIRNVFDNGITVRIHLKNSDIIFKDYNDFKKEAKYCE